MQKERDPLNLGSLPAVAPPSDGWPAIRAELEKRQRLRRRVPWWGGAMAVAAALMLAVGLFIQQPAPEAAALPDTLDSLISLSQQLETRVRAYRSQIGGLPTDTLDGCARSILAACEEALEEYGAERLEYIVLALHTLNAVWQ